MQCYEAASSLWLATLLLTVGLSLLVARRVFAHVRLFRFNPIPPVSSSQIIPPTSITSFATIFAQRQFSATTESRETVWLLDQTFIFQQIPLAHGPVHGLTWTVDVESFSVFLQIGTCVLNRAPTSFRDSQGHEAAQKLLRDLEEHPAFGTSRFKCATVFKSITVFHGLIWLGEERAKIYPSEARTPSPIWFDIPLEGYARLCGVQRRTLQTVAGSKHIRMNWSDFINECQAGDHPLPMFGNLLKRLLGGNEVLLSSPIRRVEKWQTGMRADYDILVQQLLFNLALCCDLTQELRADMDIEN